MSKREFIESPKIPVCTNIVGGLGNFAIRADHEGTEWWFCGFELKACFGLPDDVQAVQFRAFTEDGPGRHEVTLFHAAACALVHDDHECDNRAFDDPADRLFRYIDDDTMLDIIRLLGRRRKTWFIEVFYWV